MVLCPVKHTLPDHHIRVFKFVINALLPWITDKLVEGFRIEGFGWTPVAAILITMVDTLLRWVLLL
jgi:putative membrane protein